MSAHAVGLDLGGTQIKAVVVSTDGAILHRETRETRDGSEALAWAHEMRDLADAIGRDLPVGISAPGLAAADGRSISYMPGRLQGLEGLDWTEFLARKSSVPACNDAHASLLGEAWIGAAKNLQNCMMLTLGTGVGGAILADGKILRGHIGRAGHLGHITLDWKGAPDIVGMPGSLEDFIGNHNIRERSSRRFGTTHELVAAYCEGDPFAADLWLSSVRALAVGIASLVNVLDPEAVVIGGGIIKAGDALLAPLCRELDQMEWRPGGHRVRVVAAELGEWAGAIGAARNALLSGSISNQMLRPDVHPSSQEK